MLGASVKGDQLPREILFQDWQLRLGRENGRIVISGVPYPCHYDRPCRVGLALLYDALRYDGISTLTRRASYWVISGLYAGEVVHAIERTFAEGGVRLRDLPDTQDAVTLVAGEPRRPHWVVSILEHGTRESVLVVNNYDAPLDAALVTMLVREALTDAGSNSGVAVAFREALPD